MARHDRIDETLARPAPPSGRLVSAILSFADLQEELGANRTRLRLSARRAAEPEVRAALGPDAVRAEAVVVIYDEREEQILDVAVDPLAQVLPAPRPTEPCPVAAYLEQRRRARGQPRFTNLRPVAQPGRVRLGFFEGATAP